MRAPAIPTPPPIDDPTDDSQDRLHGVLAEYLEAIESGDDPDPTSILGSHPEVAGDLVEFLTVIEQLDRYIEGLRPPRRHRPAFPLPGSFGDYELMAEVGRGGMGIVYMARQRSLNRRVALKVMREGTWEPARDSRRFRTEAEAAAHLDHPQIVPIFEIGEHAGRPYFTMKLYEGGSLAQHLQEFSNNPRRAAALVGSIATAVHHAHQRGILHRDLKPSNILLDSEGRPHVADFGLAKWLHLDEGHTRTEMPVGTPAFMAPEQTSGPSDHSPSSVATTACDVYGLGAILFTVLTGRPPFRGTTALDVLLAIREEPPPAPAKLNPLVDPDLDTICLKCLEKEPSRRYSSALALAEDLERWEAGEPIMARPIGHWERTRRWCRRNPVLASASAAVVALLLLGITALATGYLLVSRAREKSERFRLRAELHAAQLRERLYAGDIGAAFRQVQTGQLDQAEELLDEYEDDGDLKGFEWHWLKANVAGRPRETVRYLKHRHILYGCAFSPDGRMIATCGADRTIQLWDSATGAEHATLHPSPPPTPNDISRDENCVRFSPDGRKMASGCEDGTVRLWNLADLDWRALQPGHHGEVLAVDFSRDGRWMLSAGADQIVRVWDLSAPGTHVDFHGHAGPVISAAFSPDGQEVASAAKNGGLHVWNRKSLAIRFSAVPGGSLYSLAYSPDGKLLACGSQSGMLHVWDTSTFGPVRFQNARIGPIRAVDFSPDSSRLMVAGEESRIGIWSVQEGELIWRFNGQQGHIWGGRFAPDGARLVTVGVDHTARVWRLPPRPVTVHWIGSGLAPARHVVFAPGGTTLAVSLRDGHVRVGDFRDPGGLELLPFINGGLTPPAFSEDGQELAVVDRRGRVDRWDLRHRREIPPFDPPPLSPENREAGEYSYAIRLAYTAGGSLTALRCDGRMWTCVGDRWQEHLVPCTSRSEPPLLSPTADRKGLLICDLKQSFVRLWSTETAQFVREFSCPVDLFAGSSVGGRYLAFANDLGNISLVDTTSGSRPRPPLIGHSRQVTSLAFSPDGKTLASAGLDGVARLWHVASGEQLFILEDLDRGYLSVAFSSDGRFLAVAGDRYINGKSIAIYDARSFGDDRETR